jgi:excisionase family DNA binding protein
MRYPERRVLSRNSICYHCSKVQDRVPLYVRLPRDQAVALDRLVDATGQRKQHLVSELLADRLEVGRIEVAERSGAPLEQVLTLDELARLLRLPTDALQTLAREGELPGRCIGGEWRFAHSAILDWLSQGEQAEHGGAEAGPPGADE